MTCEKETIINCINSNTGLVRLLPSIGNIAIIEYDGADIEASLAIYDYMSNNGIDTDSVKNIVLLGTLSRQKKENAATLSCRFSNATVTCINKKWDRIVPEDIAIPNILAFHVGASVGISRNQLYKRKDTGENFLRLVVESNYAYYVCILKDSDRFWTEECVLITQLKLKVKTSVTAPFAEAQMQYCIDKQDYLKDCQDHLIPKDAFLLCMQEVDAGCENCNQCNKYGKDRKCPMAQREISKFYRDGIFVPKNETIAHQWEIKAARQGYIPAIIQAANDQKEGFGCKQDIESAIKGYKKVGTTYCIKQILECAEKEWIDSTTVIPYIVSEAQKGDEDMIIRLSDAFQEGHYGLPKDMAQQKEWIQQGAENGNPRFVKAMAEMYETNAEWSNSYKWYKTLRDIAPQMAENEKIEEIEIKMLTDGASPDIVATKGMNYLYGFHGVDRDARLAFQCLTYAKKHNIYEAEGLLGQIYYDGIGVEEDRNKGILLLTNAAIHGDIISMDRLINIHFDEGNDYNDGEKWYGVLIKRINEGIKNDLTEAYYLKGMYHNVGFLLDLNPEEGYKLMKIAAERNHPQAQYELAQMYKYGDGVEENNTYYNDWLKKSAENGYFKAQGEYGKQLYNSGYWNKAQAFPLMMSAFEQGFDECRWELAQAYHNGDGTMPNDSLAWPLYLEEANDGNADAQVAVCKMFWTGNAIVEKSYSHCLKWGEKAISNGKNSVRFEVAYCSSHLGNHDRAKELYLELANEGNANAMNNYACELNDKKESFEWFLKAADNGNDYGIWNIARYYRDGTAVEKDLAKAIDLFENAASKGVEGAMIDLARLYRYGDDGIEINYEKAIEWYLKAAERNHPDKYIDIAELFKKKQDLNNAITFYKKAIESNIEEAIIKLAELYEDNEGLMHHLQNAIFWYRKAAKKGNENAKVALKRLGLNWLDEDGKLEDGN